MCGQEAEGPPQTRQCTVSQVGFSGIPKPELIMGDDHCSVVHYLISWWAEGVPDIGFSLCTAPTYCQVSEYFRLKSQGFGVNAKGCSTKVQA